MIFGKRNPRLNAKERHGVNLGFTIGPLGARDTSTRNHPVGSPRLNPCVRPEAIPVVHLVTEQVANGRTPDVRMSRLGPASIHTMAIAIGTCR